LPLRKLLEIQQTPFNLKHIEALEVHIKAFSDTVKRATRGCCFCAYTKLFGTIEQNSILLRKNFEGHHFWINSANGGKLDCMFFPCTSGEENISSSGALASGRYLTEPTVLICNPNALLY